MSPELLQLVGQLGIAGVLFYLLLEERKARQTDAENNRQMVINLENRIFEYLERHIVPKQAEE